MGQTGTLEAKLREILADEYERGGYLSAARSARGVEGEPREFANLTIHAMTRAFALGRLTTEGRPPMTESNSETKSHAKESEASPTPGPWATNQGQHGSLYITAGNGIGIAETYEPGQAMHRLTGALNPEANARLIAAAPTMLATLDEIASHMHGLPRGRTADHVERICREAIAKATGATP